MVGRWLGPGPENFDCFVLLSDSLPGWCALVFGGLVVVGGAFPSVDGVLILGSIYFISQVTAPGDEPLSKVNPDPASCQAGGSNGTGTKPKVNPDPASSQAGGTGSSGAAELVQVREPLAHSGSEE